MPFVCQSCMRRLLRLSSNTPSSTTLVPQTTKLTYRNASCAFPPIFQRPPLQARLRASTHSRSFSSSTDSVPAEDTPNAPRNPPKQRSPATDIVSFRKNLKEAAANARKEKRRQTERASGAGKDEKGEERWELTVGIEIHAALNFGQKLFSDAPTSTLPTPRGELGDAKVTRGGRTGEARPNTCVALFDAAFPGAQPAFQREAVVPAVRAALALGCSVQRRSAFDRKHYFWWDQPAGYQITQFYEPFAVDGSITLYPHDGIASEDYPSVTVGIARVQLEQDTAKTVVGDVPADGTSTHLLDFNRVSHPLVEIVSRPHMHRPQTAAAFVRKVQAALRAANAVTAGMEAGGLRADVNVSVRDRRLGTPVGEANLGQRTEIKNLSSIKAIEDAVVAERDRQIGVLEGGGVVIGETRGWALGGKETRRLRGKEGEVDYRYMPDPDIPPLIIADELVEHLRATLPELPDETAERLNVDPRYGLSPKDAWILITHDDGERLEYYMEVVALLERELGGDEKMLVKVGRAVGNWVIHELGALQTAAGLNFSPARVPATHLSATIAPLLRGTLTTPSARLLLATLFGGDLRPPHEIIAEDGLALARLPDAEYEALARRVADENPGEAEFVRGGGGREKARRGKLMWLVGRMMRRAERSGGAGGGIEAPRAERALRGVLGVAPAGEDDKGGATG